MRWSVYVGLAALIVSLFTVSNLGVTQGQATVQTIHLDAANPRLEWTASGPVEVHYDGVLNGGWLELIQTPVATPEPTVAATPEPTVEPTPEPTMEPTAEPTVTVEPTAEPTPEPTAEPTPTPEPEPDNAFFVDCDNGNDGNSGRSSEEAWKTVERANNAEISAGEALLFERGCTFNDPLVADWVGTEAAPITIGAYGEGDNPRFRDNNGPSIQVSGQWLIIQHLTAFHERGDYPTTDVRGDCTIPQGWRMGVVVNGDDNVLRQIEATQNAVGVFFQDASERNLLTESRLVDNEFDPNSSIGPTGVLLHGTGNEISYSHFEGNQGECSPPGTAFEIYKAYDSWIHHNTVMYDRKFAEMGVSADTLIEHNKMYNHFELGGNGSQGIVTRGEGVAFGPVLRTTIRYNTFWFNNPDDATSATIINCGACAPNIIEAHHNILVTARRAVWVGGTINEHDNLYWNPATGGMPTVQGFTPTNPVVADPLLVDPANGDFSRQSGSPATGYGAE